jgi:sugar lactone lactonase YvrE
MIRKPNGNQKRILIATVIILVPFGVVIVSPTLRQGLRELGPFKKVYLKYSKWRYDWRSPSDMGNGKDAAQIIIEGPMGLGEDQQGNVYISDRADRLIWKIEQSMRATVIAGSGMVTKPTGIPRTILPANEVDFASPEGLVVDKDGSILLADSLNHAVLKIDNNGYLTHVAGNGSRGYSGDEKPATEASLSSPYDVRLDSKGNIYIADLDNQRVRKIDSRGIITTVAGTGTPGYSGDGGPAVKAQLNTPYGILLDKHDNLLIADSDNHVIRKVDQDGIIRTIAGSGQRGFEGDGGPALAAKFDSPQALALDPNGRLYIGDEHNNAIRILEPDGTVRTLVGTKGPGFSGDGGPASLAQIADPENIWVRSDGSILITARDNSRVRIVHPDGTINTFAGLGPTSKHDYFAPIRLPPIDQ